jgi:hypothetical protein
MSLSQWQLNVQRALFYKLWSSDGRPNSCRPRGNGVQLQCRQHARKTLIKGKWHADSLLKLLLLLLCSSCCYSYCAQVVVTLTVLKLLLLLLCSSCCYSYWGHNRRPSDSTYKDILNCAYTRQGLWLTGLCFRDLEWSDANGWQGGRGVNKPRNKTIEEREREREREKDILTP